MWFRHTWSPSAGPPHQRAAVATSIMNIWVECFLFWWSILKSCGSGLTREYADVIDNTELTDQDKKAWLVQLYSTFMLTVRKEVCASQVSAIAYSCRSPQLVGALAGYLNEHCCYCAFHPCAFQPIPVWGALCSCEPRQPHTVTAIS